MEFEVVWNENAQAELHDIVSYVAAENPRAALKVLNRIWGAAAMLSDMPIAYRRGAALGTREKVVQDTPYILVYRVDESVVRILSVFHAAQDIPRGG